MRKCVKYRRRFSVKESKKVLRVEFNRESSKESNKEQSARSERCSNMGSQTSRFFWDEVLDRQLEISSMGIRVDAAALDYQLRESGCDDRRNLPFHKMLLADELPLTIGGGIGQSRLSMLMLGCAHIGEVQSSVWDEKTVKTCREAGIPLL